MGKKPIKNDAASAGTARMINVALLVGAVLVAAGIIWYAVRTPTPTNTANLPKPNVQTLAPDQFSGIARTAYEAAKEVPEVLAQLPCFCGCMGSQFGHKNNLDCFRDHHGEECTMCQDIALDARQMFKNGFTIERIRESIVSKYGQYASLSH